MRAHRWIVSLLPLVTAMQAAAAAKPDATPVGTVLSVAREVNGTMLPQGRQFPLSLKSAVCLHMEVATKEGPDTRIGLGLGPTLVGKSLRTGTPVTSSAPPPPCAWPSADSPVPAGAPPPGSAFLGSLILGANSKVIVQEWLVEDVTRPKVTLSALVGHYRAFFTPRPSSEAGGQVRIEIGTEHPPKHTLILHGTAICLHVAPDGTTLLAVLEGSVTVTSKGGGKVRVAQGSWTEFAPDGPPRPPSPLDSHIGTLSPHAGGPAFTMPGEMLISDSPFINLRRLTSDLPKARYP
jgi:hypothetical protein